ncbi:MAG: single-stranded-DNA-specific exonuclease RecJ [Syntrophorhabdales bacterium]
MLKLESYEKEAVRLLEERLNLPNLIARVLAIRGIETVHDAERFLYPSLDHLSDPFLLPDIGPAVSAVMEALASGRKIGLFGDYDADGITATALMAGFLERLGAALEVYLPGREEGYGLNSSAVRVLREKGVDLLICLDCGSSNVAELELARQLGMEAVVIDHHEVGDPHPPSRALVNPKRRDSVFPTRDLAACGVTFFFLLALRRTLHERGLLRHPINLKRELDLVTIGTVGDMVPLTGDNRILVKFGMRVMQGQPKPWLRSILKQNLLFQQRLDSYALSFVIVPRINAAGRVSHPMCALQFLLATEEKESGRLLAELNKANRERQEIEEAIIREAQEKIAGEGLADRRSLVLSKEDWPIGVIGIAAQKLAEAYGKPCIILTRVDGTWKGSARGVPGLDLHGTVGSVSSLLIRFGGHRHACGLSLAEENMDLFPQAFEEAVRRCLPETERSVVVDAIVEFDELTADVVEYIELLAPFGLGNPRPSFLLAPSSVSVNNRFVKLIDRQNRTWHGNLYRKMEMPDSPGFKVVACPTLREDLGEKFIHLQVTEFLAE